MDNRFSPKVFAILLEKAKGTRSWRQFAFDCDISYVQMRKLAQAEQINPPRPKLIKKVADHSFGDIDFEDLMFAAGLARDGRELIAPDTGKADAAYARYRALPSKDKALVNEFVAFLSSRTPESDGE